MPKSLLAALREKAERTANWRGHALRWRPAHHSKDRSYQVAFCTRCPCAVCIKTHPLPNEIDIGGSAVAIGCH